jgi:transcription elongation factor Elf1
MGMFDTVIFTCPACGGQVEVQSKAGECVLARIDPAFVPIAIAANIDGDVESCDSCNESYTVEAVFPIKTIQMKICRT